MMDDLISRQAAIDALNEYFSRIGKLKRRGLDKGEKAISLDTVGVVETLPSAQKHGKWIYPTDITGFGRCNNCKALWDKSLIDNIYFKYCPRCGARMEGRHADT